MLRGGELCVCQIVDVLDVPQPKASRHLAYLRNAGLVLARREGRWSYYRLAGARNELHGTLLGSLAHCCQGLPELLRDDERLGRKRACCD
jgi:ArsR family transcriptional regulator